MHIFSKYIMVPNPFQIRTYWNLLVLSQDISSFFSISDGASWVVIVVLLHIMGFFNGCHVMSTKYNLPRRRNAL